MVKKTRSKTIMDFAGIDLALARIAAEIHENLGGAHRFALIGIRRRGVTLARRLSRKLEAILNYPIQMGIQDITLYRDDLSTISNRPMLRETSIDFDINHLSLILVDDVLFTGRTVRAALDGLIDLGRPKQVQLAVLVDRGGRELPIQANYIGKQLQVDENELVDVRLMEEDGEERVVLVRQP